MFGFLELSVLTSAVRARRSMREHGSAGVDGIAVWVLTSLSASLSAMDARSFPEAVFRLAAPLVAAWLWERGMAVERRRITGRSGIHWRITPERILVRFGLAEPTGRSAGQVAIERRLTALALAAKRARDHHGRWAQRTRRRLDTAMRRAIVDTALATDPTQQQHLLAQLAALTNTSSLLSITSTPPWLPTTAPPVPGGGGSDAGGKRGRPGSGSPVRVKVLRLRQRHPDWTLAQIAEHAGCTERTVSRHLAATAQRDDPAASAA
jgi:hypothetical protein